MATITEGRVTTPYKQRSDALAKILAASLMGLVKDPTGSGLLEDCWSRMTAKANAILFIVSSGTEHEIAGKALERDRDAELSMADRILDVMQSRGLMADDADVLAVIEAMRDPTEAMWLSRPVDCPKREVWQKWWGWQIDAMYRRYPITPPEPRNDTPP